VIVDKIVRIEGFVAKIVIGLSYLEEDVQGSAPPKSAFQESSERLASVLEVRVRWLLL
jgi:hypothetical protein